MTRLHHHVLTDGAPVSHDLLESCLLMGHCLCRWCLCVFSQSHGVISWSALFSSSHGMQTWNRILTQLPCQNYPSSALNPETAADTQWSVYRHKLLTDCHVSHCSEKKCRHFTAKEAFCGLIIDLLAVTMSPCRGNSSLLLLSEPSLSQSTVWTQRLWMIMDPPLPPGQMQLDLVLQQHLHSFQI